MTSLVLVNVVYFKAHWLQPFNSQDTKVEKFHINRNEEAFIAMMHIKTFFSYRHAQHLSVQILELPYEVCTCYTNVYINALDNRIHS